MKDKYYHVTPLSRRLHNTFRIKSNIFTPVGKGFHPLARPPYPSLSISTSSCYFPSSHMVECAVRSHPLWTLLSASKGLPVPWQVPSSCLRTEPVQPHFRDVFLSPPGSPRAARALTTLFPLCSLHLQTWPISWVSWAQTWQDWAMAAAGTSCSSKVFAA